MKEFSLPFPRQFAVELIGINSVNISSRLLRAIDTGSYPDLWNSLPIGEEAERRHVQMSPTWSLLSARLSSIL